MPESKSSSDRPGWRDEDLALKFYLKLGFQCLARRQKWAGVEVDLLLRDRSGLLVLVEVKSDRGGEFRLHRLSHRQKRRLERAATWISGRWPGSVLLELALVDRAHCVHRHEISGLELGSGVDS